MGCCNRPPAGGPEKKEMGKLVKLIVIFWVVIFVIAYLFG